MKEFLAAFRSRFKAKAADGAVTADDYADIERWAISHTGGVATANRKKAAEIVATGDHSGLFVGYFLSDAEAGTLAVQNGESDLHLTILYCGDVSEMDDLELMRAITAISDWARWQFPLTGEVSGVGRFQADPEEMGMDAKDAVVALVDVPGLAEMRTRLLTDSPALNFPPEGDVHGLQPHITLAYIDPGAPLPVDVLPPLTIKIDRITISAGDRQWVVPLGGSFLYSETEGHKRLFVESQALMEAPEWLPCLPTPCTLKHPTYGVVDFSAERIGNFVANFNAGVYQSQVAVDGEHETKESGAMGWVKELRVNDDGSADARVEWGKRGVEMLDQERYKYVSPEFYDKWNDPLTGETHKDILIGLALTTRPFIKESALRAIAASESTAREDIMPEPTPAPESTPAPTTEAAQLTEQVTPLQFAEQAKALAESQAAQKALSEQVATMQTEARTRRFTEEVRGKSDSNGRAWFGEPEKHVAFLNDLAEKFGEDSDQVKFYVTNQRAQAEQNATSSLFKEMGSNVRPEASTKMGELNALRDEHLGTHPDLTPEKAFAEVIKTPRGKKLFAEHRAEQGVN